jgi:hypothetical protein
MKNYFFATCLLITPVCEAVTVFSVAPAPGDNFFNAGPTNMGSAIGTSNWYYNNVRQSGSAGIDNVQPRNGNGSMHLTGTGNLSKADAEFYSASLLTLGTLSSLGSLANLSALSYSYYRSSSSTNLVNLAPSLRVYIDADGNLGTTTDRGYLVFEPTNNNGNATILLDQWITTDVFNYNGPSLSANVWGTGVLDPSPINFSITLNQWMTGSIVGSPDTANAAVLGFSSGTGSGWTGIADYYVDDIAFGFGGASTTYNFEVVPEASSTLIFAFAGIAGFFVRKRS